MKKPDYSKYTLDELRQAYRSIDRQAYPERLARLEQELESRKSKRTKRKSSARANTSQTHTQLITKATQSDVTDDELLSMENDVFERTETDADLIGDRLYNLVIGIVLLWGFGINWLIVQNVPVESVRSMNLFVFLIGYFASCILGVYLFNHSTKPLVSFVGYNFVVLPFGIVVNLVVSDYDSSLVMEAMRITAAVTLLMMVLGTTYPSFFRKIAGGLTIALLAVILVEVFEIFVLGIHHGFLDWGVVLIFCGYIGYDWARANAIPKTLDNAVDSAAALYMDIVNLFLRILRILGRRN